MPAAEWAGAVGPCAPGRASPWGANAMGLTPNLTLLFAFVPVGVSHLGNCEICGLQRLDAFCLRPPVFLGV